MFTLWLILVLREPPSCLSAFYLEIGQPFWLAGPGWMSTELTLTEIKPPLVNAALASDGRLYLDAVGAESLWPSRDARARCGRSEGAYARDEVSGSPRPEHQQIDPSDRGVCGRAPEEARSGASIASGRASPTE